MNMETTILGGGCFWCVEAVVQLLKGVETVESGYAGGPPERKPTYREVCSGRSGYAEVIKVTFDSDVLSYHDLITIFMTSHDPTTLNRQGADSGTQYRSVIYYYSEEQKRTAELVFEELKPVYSDPIMTELSPAPEFYMAEIDHQNYYKDNTQTGYCRVVIDPKIAKLRRMYADRLK
jgi:peptide-methionine (S)-S-oxide reductase